MSPDACHVLQEAAQAATQAQQYAAATAATESFISDAVQGVDVSADRKRERSPAAVGDGEIQDPAAKKPRVEDQASTDVAQASTAAQQLQVSGTDEVKR